MREPTRASATRDVTFPLFDGLRGLAAAMVFIVHGGYQFAVARPGEDGAWYRFAIHLDVAVPVFFAISGFLLYRPFVAARVRGRPFSVRRYAVRRFLRIVPAYWVALPIIVLWFDIDEVQSLGGWLWYGGFLQLYDPDTAFAGMGQAWTLGTEVTYYASLPLIAIALMRFATREGRTTIRTELIGVLALIAGAWAWMAVTLRFTDVSNLESASTTLVRILPNQFDHLGAGMLLAVLSVGLAEHGPGAWERALRFVQERAWVLWLAAGAVWLATCYIGRSGSRSSYSYSDRQFYAEHILYTPFVFALLAPAVFGDDRRDLVRRLLGWRPLRYLGMVSYSFYLWHFAVLVQQYRWVGAVPYGFLEWVAWLAAAFVLSLAIATVSFFAIERPFMNLRYGGGRSAKVAPARG